MIKSCVNKNKLILINTFKKSKLNSSVSSSKKSFKLTLYFCRFSPEKNMEDLIYEI